MCPSRCAEAAPAIYWPEGTVLPWLLCVWFGNRLDRPISKHCSYTDAVQCVWSHVQHSLHHPIQPHLRVPQGGRGQFQSVTLGQKRTNQLFYKFIHSMGKTKWAKPKVGKYLVVF